MFMSREEVDTPRSELGPRVLSSIMLYSTIFTGDQKCWDHEESN